MSDLDTIPPTIEVGSSEIYPLLIDYGVNLNLDVDHIQSVTAVMFSPAGTDVASSAIDGLTVAQLDSQVEMFIKGTELTVGAKYRLHVTAIVNERKHLTAQTTVWCR